MDLLQKQFESEPLGQAGSLVSLAEAELKKNSALKRNDRDKELVHRAIICLGSALDLINQPHVLEDLSTLELLHKIATLFCGIAELHRTLPITTVDGSRNLLLAVFSRSKRHLSAIQLLRDMLAGLRPEFRAAPPLYGDEGLRRFLSFLASNLDFTEREMGTTVDYTLRMV